MSKQTESSLLIYSPFAKYAALYQQLLRGIASYEELGNRIIAEIKLAHAFRQSDRVRELSRLLMNIPIKEYKLIAEYYLVWCECRELNCDVEVIERIIEQTRTYKAKAISTRAAFEVYQGRTEEAFYFYREAIKATPNASEYIHILRAIAILKAQEGFHKSAIKDLESLLPVLHHTEPLVYYDILNSYAVELSEAGRNQEAHNIMRHVVASPFAPAYPEWRETFTEVNQKLYKGRSSVTVPTPKKQLEEAKPEAVAKPQPKANVIAFPKREVSDDDILETLDKLDNISLTPLQLLGVLLKVVLKERITSEEVDRICNAYYQLIREYYAE